MRRTPLYPAHLALKARMVDFGGWEMPVQYSTILEEHRAVRERAGIFDVSHMGDLLVRGRGAEASLRGLLNNDIKDLTIGKGLYAHLLDDHGRIIDDIITFRLSAEGFLMVPNASHVPEVHEWVQAHLMDATVIDLSDRLACVALQGPQAHDVLQRFADEDLAGIKHLRGGVVDLRVSGSPGRALPGLDEVVPADGLVRCFISRSGYTGEDGFEIIVASDAAIEVWDALLTEGKATDIAPCGLGSRDLLRLEMGYLLSGTDFDGAQTTLQTGPEWVVKWGHEFIGREALERQRAEGGYPKLVGLELRGRGVPRHGYAVTSNGHEVGIVTSGTLSPMLNRGIALAYVDHDRAAEGTELAVRIREAEVPAVVVRPPFIRRVSG